MTLVPVPQDPLPTAFNTNTSSSTTTTPTTPTTAATVSVSQLTDLISSNTFIYILAGMLIIFLIKN